MSAEARCRVIADIYEAIADRDLEKALALTSPDWSFEVDTDAVTGDTAYRGHDGLRDWFAAISQLDGFVTKPRDMVAHDGRIAVLSTTSVRGEDGSEISILGLSFWDVDEAGLVRSIEGVTDPDRVSQLLSRIHFRR